MSNVYDLVVTIATFKRPDFLRSLLLSLEAQTDLGETTFHVVLVDNDPEGSAKKVAEQFTELVTYTCEPRPGIAAARNAGVEAARAFRPSSLVFIDDDEVAPPIWLSELLKVRNETLADVVTGPVRYELPSGFEHLMEAVPHFQTIERPDRSSVQDVATGNTLVDAKWFHGPNNLRFSERYSMTGGSDVELFNRLRAEGGRCLWASAASVVEFVPPSRATPQWMRQRDLRNGQLRARLKLETNKRAAVGVAAGGVLRIVKGSLMIGLSPAGSTLRIQAWRTLQTGRGYLRAITGNHFNEYAVGLDTRGQLPRTSNPE